MNFIKKITNVYSNIKRDFRKFALVSALRLYDAAKTTDHRTKPTDSRSGDAVMGVGGVSLRKWARHLDENHDLAIGILDDLVNNVVGSGLHISPMIKTTGGELAVDVNKRIKRAFNDWSRKAEISGELPFFELQRQAARSWFRDGEVLLRHLEGSGIPHFGRVPYSIQALESEYLPYSDITGKPNVIQGIEKNAWNQALNYYLHKNHPGDTQSSYTDLTTVLKVKSDNIIHLKFTRRLNQTRGVSVFHGVITRLADIKDYEESERIAARIAADMTAYVKRAADFAGEVDSETGERSLQMQAGMIIDNLLPGEELGMIASDRPNPNLGKFRGDQMRAVSSGTGTKYSTISKDFSGSYSSQRQELVEAFPAYEKLRNYFTDVALKPIYERWLRMAIASGVVKLAVGIDTATINDIDVRSNPMPWIDPLKEVKGEEIAVKMGFKSKAMVQREKYGDPDMINEQLKQEGWKSEQEIAEQIEDEDEDEEPNGGNEKDKADG